MSPENWTALATVVIAVFTIVLAIGGGYQACLTRRAIRLGRDEFNATHRAEIIIHSAEHAHVDGMKIGANITFFNKGTTPARNVVISGKITTISGVPRPGIAFPELLRVPEDVFPGKPWQFGIPSNIQTGFEQIKLVSQDTWKDMKSDPAGVYCIGEISYTDAGGVVRHTGFCWKWHTSKNDGHRWIRQSRNSYEYAY